MSRRKYCHLTEKNEISRTKNRSNRSHDSLTYESVPTKGQHDRKDIKVGKSHMSTYSIDPGGLTRPGINFNWPRESRRKVHVHREVTNSLDDPRMGQRHKLTLRGLSKNIARLASHDEERSDAVDQLKNKLSEALNEISVLSQEVERAHAMIADTIKTRESVSYFCSMESLETMNLNALTPNKLTEEEKELFNNIDAAIEKLYGK